MTETDQQLNTDDNPEIAHLGRLHLVTKALKDANCRECSNVIKKGETHYNQHVYGEGHFPISSKVCYNCGQMLNQKGCKIVTNADKKKAKEIEKQGELK